MVPHAGEESRTFREVKRIGAELSRLAPEVSGAGVAAEVAVLHDWHSWWAVQQEGHAVPGGGVPGRRARAWHRALWENGYATDFAHPEHGLSGYRIGGRAAVVPAVGRGRRGPRRLRGGGGTLVSGFLTGVADPDDRVRPGGMDARLRRLFGIRVLHEWWPLDRGERVACDGFDGTLWSEELEAAGDAEVAAAYRGRAGRAAGGAAQGPRLVRVDAAGAGGAARAAGTGGRGGRRAAGA